MGTAAVEYVIREPLRGMMPNVAFFAEAAPASARTNVGQRLALRATAGADADGRPEDSSASHRSDGGQSVAGSSDPYAMGRLKADEESDQTLAGDAEASNTDEGLDEYFAIPSVGDDDYVPPTRASRTASGTLAAIGLMQIGMTPMQLAAVGGAAVAISLFMPTYEDMLAARARAEMAKERHRAGLN